jgi:hypothetical protein
MDSRYELKPGPYSSHTLITARFPRVGDGRRVLDVGCAEGYIEEVLPTGIPIALAYPRWENSWVVRAAERAAYVLARVWRTLFAYPFVVVARPEVPL